MPLKIRDQGRHLYLPIGTINTNLVEDVEYAFPVKFRQILLRDFLSRFIKVRSVVAENSKISQQMRGHGGNHC